MSVSSDLSVWQQLVETGITDFVGVHVDCTVVSLTVTYADLSDTPHCFCLKTALLMEIFAKWLFN